MGGCGGPNGSQEQIIGYARDRVDARYRLSGGKIDEDLVMPMRPIHVQVGSHESPEHSETALF